jgi:hypothetical protein
MNRKMRFENNVVDVHSFKERLREKLPPDSPMLADLLAEPDSMPVGKAEVLIPHYLQRLERELERREAARKGLLTLH